MLEIRNKYEALYLACEMERRAVDIYERALILLSGTALTELLTELVADERRHLDTFTGMWEDGISLSAERKLLLAAHAGEVLFSGGLMQAQREGAFDAAQKLLEYALTWEKDAASQYEGYVVEFNSDEAVSEVFRIIAGEEREHQKELEAYINKLSTNQSLF